MFGPSLTVPSVKFDVAAHSYAAAPPAGLK